jgi:hypothetical protein
MPCPSHPPWLDQILNKRLNIRVWFRQLQHVGDSLGSCPYLGCLPISEERFSPLRELCCSVFTDEPSVAVSLILSWSRSIYPLTRTCV